MSAYRDLSRDDLETLRRACGATAIEDCRPITAGIENSNWFLEVRFGDARHALVLTLVEAVPADELPFFIALTDTLAEADLPVAMTLRLPDGRRQFRLQGRPALLVPRLPGAHVGLATPAQCRAIGDLLARLHAAASRCPFRRERPDHLWWPAAFAFVAPLLDRDTHDELAGALLGASRAFAQARALPHGVIHGDLFRDNVLLTGDEVSGVLDFFHATHDLLAWDLAIALNDWCLDDRGRPDPARAAALLAGYESQRALAREERAALPALRRAAAARFWLSRIVAAERQAAVEGDGAVQRKDPAEMRALYRALGD